MTTQFNKSEMATILYKMKYKAENDLILYYHKETIYNHLMGKLLNREQREQKRVKF